ncbi:MsnO8 family LLM class oxidoreductase [Streptomyces sp. TRM43335]|uniref:MsnO8 family LLM class oxidoreductase n=1 Tax=Streptomyces taklimakanensis TaxID=2569853 RepID=A0A6G2BI24_9ACTN|nr:MsnO8 family LLM class oxidoreductase [Streptomyces taklimakanensis]MTE21900.1 MsnO8 family LLM class oxidoreductase [Streptomyces taklimakanensis]
MTDDTLRTVRLSVLDRSLIRRGEGADEALRATVRFAREIDALGYHRFWVSEHHGVPGVAGSAPTVLAAAVASATTRVRVGTGGVMLPNHRPLVVAEQFGVLESLFPGRIDMGLGRSVGFTDAVRRALGAGKEDAERFGDDLAELLGWFSGDGARSTPRVRAVPSEGLRVPVFVLATGSGARLAAERGLPLVTAPARGEERMLRAIEEYRAAFRPSAVAPEPYRRPYVVVSVSAAAGATAEEAETMQASEAWATVVSRTRGVFPPLLPPREVLAREATERERALFAEARASQVHGTGEEVAAALGALARRSGADELLLTLNAHDHGLRLDSYRRLARLAGLSPTA